MQKSFWCGKMGNAEDSSTRHDQHSLCITDTSRLAQQVQDVMDKAVQYDVCVANKSRPVWHRQGITDKLLPARSGKGVANEVRQAFLGGDEEGLTLQS